MLYKRIKNTVNGNPRFLLECPNELDLEQAKRAGFKIATHNQVENIYSSKTHRSIPLWLIISTYNIQEDIKNLEKKYTFESDKGFCND